MRVKFLPSFCRAVFVFCLALSAALLAQEQHVLPADISLPAKGSVYAIETKDAASTLVQLHAVEIVSNSHASSNFARSMVYAGPHASVELQGLNAQTHLAGAGVWFLARLGEDETDLMRNRLTLIRLKQTGDRRVVSTFSQNIFGGQRKREYDVVPVTKTDVPEGNWVKLTPEKPLAAGEYGIVVMPKDAALFTDAVYEFDIDFGGAKVEK